jgi:hypothetical protein
MITAAIAISSDGLSTGINVKRHAQVASIMNSPDSWKSMFAAAVATDANVGADVIVGASADGNGNFLTQTVTSGSPPVTTGNSASQAVKVTDAHITTAVAAMFNSFFGGQ